MPKPLSERTLGELGAMRDALRVAKMDLQSSMGAQSTYILKRSLLRVIDVLDSIVSDTHFSRDAYEIERVRYKSEGERLR